MGEGGRDEPLAVGASRQRIKEQPSASRPAEGDDSEPVSIEAQLTLLRQLYGARIEITLRDLPRHKRAAAIKALRRELKAAIRAITERRSEERAARRIAARLRRIPFRHPEPNK